MKEKKRNIINTEHTAKGLTSLSEGISSLAKKLLGKQGMVEIEILSNWHNIVGEELAKYTCPQRIDFKKDTRNEGTLFLLTVSGSFAMEIQHKTPIILDKINTFFGYNAVAKIKIMQNDTFANLHISTNFDDKAEKKLVTKEEQNYISDMTEDVQNPDLKARLQSLGESIFKHNK